MCNWMLPNWGLGISLVRGLGFMFMFTISIAQISIWIWSNALYKFQRAQLKEVGPKEPCCRLGARPLSTIHIWPRSSTAPQPDVHYDWCPLRQQNYGQFWVVNSKLLKRLLKSMYEKHLSQVGRISTFLNAEFRNCHFFIQVTSRESISLHCKRHCHNLLLSRDENLLLQYGMALQRHAIHLESSGTGKKPRPPRIEIYIIFFFVFIQKQTLLNIYAFAIGFLVSKDTKTILKIGHHANPIAFAKSLLWVKT